MVVVLHRDVFFKRPLVKCRLHPFVVEWLPKPVDVVDFAALLRLVDIGKSGTLNNGFIFAVPGRFQEVRTVIFAVRQLIQLFGQVLGTVSGDVLHMNVFLCLHNSQLDFGQKPNGPVAPWKSIEELRIVLCIHRENLGIWSDDLVLNDGFLEEADTMGVRLQPKPHRSTTDGDTLHLDVTFHAQPLRHEELRELSESYHGLDCNRLLLLVVLYNMV
mmetsp:Transcript_19599/g.31110  ORF Transcript_19599/g.31110 Transcript_19599/m.31110 type:complete len:216 (-) Transcript_19599:428-1075(-)